MKCYCNGISQIFIGNLFKKYIKNKSDIIIATKVLWNPEALSKEPFLREIDLSLKLLQLDCVNIKKAHTNSGF